MNTAAIIARMALILGIAACLEACAPNVYLTSVSHDATPSSGGPPQEASLGAGPCKVALVIDATNYRAGGYRLTDYPEGVSAVAQQACLNTGLCDELTVFSSFDAARSENAQRVSDGAPEYDLYLVIKPDQTSFKAGFHPGMIGPQLIIFPVLEPFLPAPIHVRYAVGDVNWRFAAYNQQGLLMSEKAERWRKKKTFAKNCYYSGVCMSWAMRPLANQLAGYMDAETAAFLVSAVEASKMPLPESAPPL